MSMGRLLGIDRLGAYAAKFGLGEKTGVELPESKGVMAGPAFTESRFQVFRLDIYSLHNLRLIAVQNLGKVVGLGSCRRARA